MESGFRITSNPDYSRPTPEGLSSCRATTCREISLLECSSWARCLDPFGGAYPRGARGIFRSDVPFDEVPAMTKCRVCDTPKPFRNELVMSLIPSTDRDVQHPGILQDPRVLHCAVWSKEFYRRLNTLCGSGIGWTGISISAGSFALIASRSWVPSSSGVVAWRPETPNASASF